MVCEDQSYDSNGICIYSFVFAPARFALAACMDSLAGAEQGRSEKIEAARGIQLSELSLLACVAQGRLLAPLGGVSCSRVYLVALLP